MNDVIILAGGLGTRLRHVVSDTQKVMAPVAGKPFLRYLVSDLVKKGCRRIVFAVSYHSEQIRDYFGDSFEGASLVYSVETEPMGTGGAIRQALQYAETPFVTVLNGDTFFNADLPALERFREENGADIAISVRKLHNITRSGTVVFGGDGRMLSFNERRELSEGYINGGIYVMRRELAAKLPEGKFSFEKDVLEKNELRCFCLPSDGYFIDMGVPADYFRAQTEIPLLFGQRVFRAAFLDRDGVICKEKHHLYKPEDFEFIEGVPEAMERLREQGYLLIVITNQAGVAKGLYTEADVERLHGHMEKLLEGRTKLDGIYYCPYHPEGTVEAYRKTSPDRKPGTGMIERAVRDFREKGIELDLKNSILVGDTERDIETGVNAGVGRKILVRSGHTIPDEALSEADEIVDSLAAVIL